MFWPFGKRKRRGENFLTARSELLAALPSSAAAGDVARKYSPIVAQLYNWGGGGEVRCRPLRNYAEVEREGYSNPAVAFCVNRIARDGVMLPLEISIEDGDFEPLEWNSETKNKFAELRALFFPNARSSFIQQVGASMRDALLFGVLFEHAILVDGDKTLQELWRLPPQEVVPVEGKYGWPKAFEIYSLGMGAGDRLLREEVDRLGRSKMFFWKSYHPSSLKRAVAPVQMCYREVNTANEFAEINFNLAKNGAVPSAIITTTGDRPMTAGEAEETKKQMDEAFAGSSNAGKLLLMAAVDFKDMSRSSREGEFRETRNDMIRDILAQYGVPSQLYGLKDAQTYSNLSESRRAYFLSAVFPFVNDYWMAKSAWLTALLGRRLAIRVNEKRVPVMSDWIADRMVKYAGVDFLTIAEKRKLFGLPKLPDTDEILVGSGLSTLDSVLNPPETPAEDGGVFGDDDDEGGGGKEKDEDDEGDGGKKKKPKKPPAKK